ncbi:hypothetical protein ACHAXM_004834 [Skeletonema potamos]|jgi:hypothetical protein
MSKPPALAKRAAKRKAADDDAIADACTGPNALTTLDLSSKKLGLRDVADALLSLLPKNATRQHPSAKKLVKAFPLVISELERRANVLARESEIDGTRKPIAFLFPAEGKQVPYTIHLPEDTFVGMLKHLNGREIVNVSLVSKAWLAASRLPSLWTKLDRSCGLTNNSRKLNMTAFLKVLERSQFANIKHLEMPHHALQLSKNSISKLAKLLPHLETFSMNSVWGTGHKLKDEHLLALVQAFPKLTALHNIEMWAVTNHGIMSMAKVSKNLQDLRINGSLYYLSDFAVASIAHSLPNLHYFAYTTSRWSYDAARDTLSGEGILSLVRKCRRLEILELEDARNVSKGHFQEIVTIIEEGNEGEFALRKIDLRGYPFVIVEQPFRVVDIAENGAMVI